MNAWEPIGESAPAQMTAKVGPAPMVPVACPGCGRALVVLVRATRRLHRLTRGGYVGYPLGNDHRAPVPIRCDTCERRWETSGREVARAIHGGEPPLAG